VIRTKLQLTIHLTSIKLPRCRGSFCYEKGNIDFISRWFSPFFVSFYPFAFTENPVEVMEVKNGRDSKILLTGFPFNIGL
jgi:hypothetical protein